MKKDGTSEDELTSSLVCGKDERLTASAAEASVDVFATVLAGTSAPSTLVYVYNRL